MKWLKKNLSLVVGGVAALGLLGFAVYFLLTKKQAVDEATALLNAKTDELKSLTTRDPHPNQENIEIARKNQKSLAEFLQNSARFFAPVAGYTNMDSATFKGLLQTAISDLERDADKAGVHLPAHYDFTFTSQRKSVDFASDTLVPLAIQVAEIKGICDILFDARVHALTGLRRVPVAKEDQGTTDYLTGKKAITNTLAGAVLSPYEIQFQGFSDELAAVLEGFYHSSNCVIVRNIDIQTNILNVADAPPPGFMGPTPTFAPSAGVPPSRQSFQNDSMSRRYGIGRYANRPSLAPAPTPQPAPGAVAPPTRRGPETILDERPFRVTMYLETVRLTGRTAPRSAN